MTDNGFVKRLREGPLLADGAMGTLLYSRGVGYDRCFDSLNVSEPELVRRVHLDYVAAGAHLIETNTFGANAVRLAEHGLAGRVREYNLAAAHLAREVADAVEGVWVGGSVGPLGTTLAPVGALARRHARAAFAAQIGALAEGGVDAIVIETIPDLAEALIAVEAARQVCDLPVIVLLTFGEDGLTRSGDTPESVALALHEAGVEVIGANCSTGPAPMGDVMARMAAVVAHVPLAAMPNAGLPTLARGRYIYTSTPAYMAEVIGQMAASGVALVGGCCGTTPDHIASMAEALTGERPVAARVSFLFPQQTPPSEAQVPSPAALQRALQERFAVTVEVGPPRGFDTGGLLPKLRRLKDSGYVDAINVTDSPRAQARMSALAMAAVVHSEVGLEVILHTGCRHRNLVAIHSDLLGAHALGIRSIFVVMGDLPAQGDYPDATVVNDITATGLMRLLSSFNQGRDLSGRPLNERTAFHIGCALNLAASDLDREVALLDTKLEAGAQFALSQPVYDPRLVERVLRRFGGQLPIPMLMGVLPLWSARHASFLHNEVPGIEIPEAVLNRMTRAGERGTEEGVAIAQEVLQALQGGIQGAYFMPPFEKYDMVPAVMSAIRAPAQSLALSAPRHSQP